MTTPKPALPEPVAYADAANLRAAPAVDDMPIIAWPCGGELNGRFFYEPLYTADQLRAYGDARAAEARATQEPREAFAKLQAEVEALRKDAERWRWWRANFGAIVVDTEWRGGPAEGRYVRSVTLNPLLGPTEPASIDAAIDAALQGEPHDQA